MLHIKNIIEFSDFESFESIYNGNTTNMVKCKKKTSSYDKYLMKTFNFGAYSGKNQKIILEVFTEISNRKNQYIKSYKYLSFHSDFKTSFIMKCISSNTLDKYLTNSNLMKSLKFKDIMNCIFAVSEAMNFLHSSLIYHGNLCPSNILIDKANQFYVFDFGLYPIKKLYYKNKYLFNKDYKDPFMKNNEPTFTNDIYSFGVLILTLFHKHFQVTTDNDDDDNDDTQEILQEFKDNPKQKKFKKFPKFCFDLIPSCMNSNLIKRPSFNKIIETFKSKKYDNDDLKISELYNKFKDIVYVNVLADLNDPHALNIVGKYYRVGYNVEKDPQKAMKYFKKAADLDYPQAQSNYGYLLQEVGINNKPDMIEGARFLKLSAENGDLVGMFNYGLALYKGEGVKKNKKEALDWLKKASDQGDLISQIYYAHLILNDKKQSTEKVNECLSYLKNAMNKGSPDAYYCYADLLKNSVNLERNDEIIFNCYKFASEMGKVDAIYYYGICYLDGIGTPKNKETAMKYLQIAAIKGCKQAQDKINELTQNDTKREKSTQTEKTKNESNEPLCIHDKKVNAEKQSPMKNKNDSASIQPNKFSVNNEHSNQPNKFSIKEIILNKFSNDNTSSSSSSDDYQLTISEDSINENKKQISDDEFDCQNDEVTSIKIIDFNQTPEKLILLGDELSESDTSNAIKCYVEAANKGNPEAYLKCAEISPTFEMKLDYYELAIKNHVPKSFNLWRKSILKKACGSKKGEASIHKYARRFEELNDFSDAAYLYNMAKDKLNLQICYEKAKKNIDKIEDGHQQYYFGIIAKKQNDIELAREMFEKAYKNNIVKAKESIELLEQMPHKSLDKPIDDIRLLFEEGVNYYEGKNGKNKNINLGMVFLKEASKFGCVEADFYIANENKNEIGAKILQKLADSGNELGQVRYAHCLKNGIGIEKDIEKAFHYYKLSADQGNSEAEFEYGRELFLKNSNEKEKEIGLSYIKKSANKLNPNAIYLYGQIISETDPYSSAKFIKYAKEKISKFI